MKNIYRVVCAILICALIVATTEFISNAENNLYSSSYARLIMRAAINLEEKKDVYDINNDGEITTEDARIALRRAINLSDYAPSTTKKVTTTIIPSTTTTTTTRLYQQKGVLSTCGLTINTLANGLHGNLKKYAADFLEAEKIYNVNAVFLSAIAALESGWGSSSLARNKNNFFGWKGGSGFMSFNTPREGILFVARNLKNNYLTPGGSCFRGYEVEDVAKSYCPGGNWARQIYGIMNMIK